MQKTEIKLSLICLKANNNNLKVTYFAQIFSLVWWTLRLKDRHHIFCFAKDTVM